MERKEDFNLRSKRYSTEKYRLAIINLAYLLAVIFLFQRLGFSDSLTDSLTRFSQNNYLIILLYCLIVCVGHYILFFPLDIYSSYFLEHKFSLSKQKIKDWFIDQIKAGLIGFIIFVILVQVFYFILRRYPASWWWLVSAFWIFFSLILAKLTPVIIIPLFFKYRPLSNEQLRERILNLARRMKIKILDVFEIDFSKKTLKANAAFVGMGKTKRVLLADTLKDKYTEDEIEVILAHEFAHYQMKHLLKIILINSLATILCFYIIFTTHNYLLNYFNLVSLSDVSSLPVIIGYLVIWGIITQPLTNYLSRIFEIRADKAAIKITKLKDAFVSMMEKLSQQNLADRNPSRIIKFFFFDHPPIDERINLAKTIE